MNTKGLIVGAALAAVIGTSTVLIHDKLPTGPTPISTRQWREAYFQTSCPARTITVRTRGGYDCCYTTSRTALPNEVDKNNLPNSSLLKLAVCYDGVSEFNSRWFAQLSMLPIRCEVAADKIHNDKDTPVPLSTRSEMIRKLRVACGDCVSAGSWGTCPMCLHSSWPGPACCR